MFKNKNCSIRPNFKMTMSFRYKGKSYGVCCKDCIKQLKTLINNVEKAKLKNKNIENKKCVIMKDRSITMSFNYKGNYYGVCCPMCISELKKMIDKVNNALLKNETKSKKVKNKSIIKSKKVKS
tara:strand:+ start:411 stop:782 length:372 start_codon:yes stop_codon:yes gene_type:complete